MRKIFPTISFFLVIALIIMNCPVAFAQNEPKIYVTNVTAKAGTEVELSVKLYAPSAAGSNFTVEYNSTDLEYKSNKTFLSASANVSSSSKMYISFFGTNAINKEETIITITFKVNENVADGTVIPVKLSDVKVFDENGQSINVSISNGNITVRNSADTPTSVPSKAYNVTVNKLKVEVSGNSVINVAGCVIDGKAYIKLVDICDVTAYYLAYDKTKTEYVITATPNISLTMATRDKNSEYGKTYKNILINKLKIKFNDKNQYYLDGCSINGKAYIKLADFAEMINHNLKYDKTGKKYILTSAYDNSEIHPTPKPTAPSLTPAPIENRQFTGNLAEYDDINTYDFSLPYDSKVSLEFFHINNNSSSVNWKVYFINKNDLSEIIYLESRGDKTRIDAGYNAYVPKGDYIVKVVSNGYYNWSDINYTITVYFQKNVGSFEVEPNNDFSGSYTNANKAEVNKPMIGNIITYDDVDCFQYTITSPGKVWLSFEHNYLDTSSEFWEIQLLSKSDGTKLIEISSKGNSVKAVSDYCAFIPVGEYIVRVQSKGYYNWSNIDYTVTLNYEFNDGKYEIESNDTFQTANKIELSKSVTGNILTHDDIDCFSFSLTSKKEVYFDFGHFYFDSNTNYWEVVLLGKNDGKEYTKLESNGTNVSKSSNSIALNAGEYIVRVSSKGYYNWSRMEYTLTVKAK